MRRVRLVYAPEKTGTLNSSEIPIQTPKGVKYSIHLDNGEQITLFESQFEYLDIMKSPIDFVRKGKYGTIDNLKRELLLAKFSGNLLNYIYSMETSRTSFLAYQYKPVVRILESPTKGLLIADEVGLGKTIEAGLVWNELRARYAFSRLIVLCPSFLKEKWRIELKEKFSIEAELLDANGLLEYIEKFRNGKYKPSINAICSLEGLRSNEKLMEELESLNHGDYLFNLAIIDEAHKAKNSKSETHNLCYNIVRLSEFKLLLSATPVMLGSKDLFTLLNLIDPSLYKREDNFNWLIKGNSYILNFRDWIIAEKNLTVRKLTEKLESLRNQMQEIFLPFGKQLLALVDYVNSLDKNEESLSNRVKAEIVEQLDYCRLFSMTINRTRRREVEIENQRQRKPIDQIVSMSSTESRFYTSILSSFHDYLETNPKFENISVEFLSSLPQRQLSSSFYATVNRWIRKFELSGIDDNTFNATDDFVVEETEISSLRGLNLIEQFVFSKYSIDELRILRDELQSEDTKYLKLETELKSFLDENTNEKVVIFSFFKDTIDYLSTRLCNIGIESLVLYGGTANKVEVVDQFRQNKNVKVLVTSEIGSEGIDLQFCRVIVNFDLPWNPMRIEQRVGRLDRIGQLSKTITIWNFVFKDTIDERIYVRLLDRIGVFREALGGLEDFIGSKINDLSKELLDGNLTLEQENELIERTALAIETMRYQEEKLEKEAIELVSLGDGMLKRVNQVREHKAWVTAHDLSTFVKESFEKFFPQTRFVYEGTELIRYSLDLDALFVVQFESYLKSNPHLNQSTYFRSTKPFGVFFETSVMSKSPIHLEHIDQYHPIVSFMKIQWMMLQDRFKVVAGKVSIEKLQSNGEHISKGLYVFVVRTIHFTDSLNIGKMFPILYKCKDETILDVEHSQQFLDTIANVGESWLDYEYWLKDIDVEAVVGKLLAESDEQEEHFIKLQKNRILDRLEVQQRASKEYTISKISSLNEQLELQKERNNPIVPIILSKIRDAEKQWSITLEQISLERKRISYSSTDVCMGVVQVY